MKGVIYKVTNKINGKIYIGQTINFKKRQQSHILHALRYNSETLFHRAIRKYGIDNFEWKIVYTCELDKINNEESILDKMEKQLILENNSYFENGLGYNMDYGGNNHIGRKVSESARKKMRKPKSLEARRNISISKIGNKNSVGNKNNLGKKLSEETKEKIRQSAIGKNVGKKRTPEQIENHRKSVLGQKRDTEFCEKMTNIIKDKTLYHFYHEEFGDYVGMKYDFYTKYNLRKNSVYRIIKGERKSHRGWIFIEVINK